MALVRGLRKRCPRCGERGIFLSWFRLRPTCPRCDLRFEKEDGGFLGAMVVNYLVAFLVWTTVLVITMVFTVPDIPVGPLLVASVLVLVGNPLWFYPRSKALWATPTTGRPSLAIHERSSWSSAGRSVAEVAQARTIGSGRRSARVSDPERSGSGSIWTSA